MIFHPRAANPILLVKHSDYISDALQKSRKKFDIEVKRGVFFMLQAKSSCSWRHFGVKDLSKTLTFYYSYMARYCNASKFKEGRNWEYK